MTSRASKTVAATLATAALVAAPLSAYAAVSQPTLPEAAVTSVHTSRGTLVSAVPIARLKAAELDKAAVDAGFVGMPKSRYTSRRTA